MDVRVYAELLDDVSDGVYFVDRDRRITHWNRGAEQITGYSADEVIGRHCAEGILRHVSGTGRELCGSGCPLSAVMRDGKPRRADVYLHHKSGHRVAVAVRGRPVRDAEGRIIGSAEVFTARGENPYAAERRRVDEQLDSVTALLPRQPGERHLDAQLRAVEQDDATLGVLFVDADHFKAINDTFGHSTGDQVLRMIGRSMANGLRRRDIPIRWGGEEFLALLPGADADSLLTVSERLRMLVETSWIDQGDRRVRVTVSIGATLARPGEAAHEVVDRADRLMYASKRGGRNRVTTG